MVLTKDQEKIVGDPALKASFEDDAIISDISWAPPSDMQPAESRPYISPLKSPQVSVTESKKATQ